MQLMSTIICSRTALACMRGGARTVPQHKVFEASPALMAANLPRHIDGRESRVLLNGAGSRIDNDLVEAITVLTAGVYGPCFFGEQGLSEAEGQAALPIDILISKHGRHRHDDRAIAHIMTVDLPKGSLCRLEDLLDCDSLVSIGLCPDDTAIVSPELCFLQMAGELSLVKLIALGFELCGLYVMPPAEQILYDSYDQAWSNGCQERYPMRFPLTTPARLCAYLNSARGIDGLVKARRAAAYVLACSASPRETALAMLLTLPHSMGGYCIRGFELNQKVELSDDAARHFRKSYCICDLYHAAGRLAIEYDSDFAHSGDDRRQADSRRVKALTLSGESVVSVINAEITNRLAMDGIAKLIRRRLGLRAHRDTDAQLVARVRLRTELLA